MYILILFVLVGYYIMILICQQTPQQKKFRYHCTKLKGWCYDWALDETDLLCKCIEWGRGDISNVSEVNPHTLEPL